VLLHVADVDLVHHLAGNPVDDDRQSAKTSILTLAWSSASSAVTVPYFEIHRFDAFGEFLREISLEHLSHVWEAVVGHQNSHSFQVKFVPQFLVDLMDMLFP
jgi:hypothetical protein